MIFVDAHFVRATCFVFFIFVGLWARLCQGSSLGLQPIQLFYFTESLSCLHLIFVRGIFFRNIECCMFRCRLVKIILSCFVFNYIVFNLCRVITICRY